MKTIIEPFKIKSVDPIKMNNRSSREFFLEAAHYNLFYLPLYPIIIKVYYILIQESLLFFLLI